LALVPKDGVLTALRKGNEGAEQEERTRKDEEKVIRRG
jgi:hypothetical protein